MPQLFRPALSPSPVTLAFSFIDWTPPTIAISRPEQSLLRSAEENPLEYIIADYQEAYAYARLLLKVLDQVTGPSNPGRVSELRLEDVGLDDEGALEYLTEDKSGVVTHYLITKLYDFIGLLTEQPPQSPVQLSTVFYQHDKLLEDWRPLLRILYRQGDAFSQRGAALSLMYILKAGCRQQTAKKIHMVEETLQSLVSWLTSRLQSSHLTSLKVVTPTLLVLGTCQPARRYFNSAGGIGYLSRHLRPKKGVTKRAGIGVSDATMRKIYSGNNTNVGSHGYSDPSPTSKARTQTSFSSVQQLYELCFCLWTMAHDCTDDESMKHHFARDGAIAALAELIAAAPREKVIRLALSSLRHLAQVDAELFVPEMIACRVLKSIDLLNEQKQWTDPDMTEGTTIYLAFID
jgi:V-ATPase subunit H